MRDTMISFEEVAPSADEMRARMSPNGDVWPWLVAEDAGSVLGYAYGSRHRSRASYRWSVDVSVYLADGARGRGVGRTLYGALLPLLEGQGFHTAFAGIGMPNDASVGLHTSVGFTLVGTYREVGFKLGTWHDVTWWSRDLGPRGRPPHEPVSVSALDESILRRCGIDP